MSELLDTMPKLRVVIYDPKINKDPFRRISNTLEEDTLRRSWSEFFKKRGITPVTHPKAADLCSGDGSCAKILADMGWEEKNITCVDMYKSPAPLVKTAEWRYWNLSQLSLALRQKAPIPDEVALYRQAFDIAILRLGYLEPFETNDVCTYLVKPPTGLIPDPTGYLPACIYYQIKEVEKDELIPTTDVAKLEQELLISPDDQDGLIKDVLARLAVVTKIEGEEAKSGSSHRLDKKIIFSTDGSSFIRKTIADPTRLPSPVAIRLPPVIPLFEYVLHMARIGPLKTAGNEMVKVEFLIELPNQATIFGGGIVDQEEIVSEKNFEIFEGVKPTDPIIWASLNRLLEIPNDQSQQKRTETLQSPKIEIKAGAKEFLKSLFRNKL